MQTTAFVPMQGAQGETLGFFHLDRNGYEVIFHGGDLVGWHADLALLPKEGVGIFLDVNSDGWGSLLNSADTLRGSFVNEFMDRYFPRNTPERVLPTVSTAAKDARIVAGKYQLSRRSEDNWADLVYLLVEVPITARPDGTIETPGWLNMDTGRAQRWREVGPFKWQEVGGTAGLNMNVVNGRVTEWLPTNIPYGFVFQSVSFWRSQRFIFPLTAYICAVILLECVCWPIAAMARRRCGRKLNLPKRECTSLQLTRCSTLVGAGFILSLLGVGLALAEGWVSPDPALDPWLREIQVIGLILVPAALISVWNAWVTLVSNRTMWGKAWSVLLAGALLSLSWFSFAFHLMKWKLNY